MDFNIILKGLPNLGVLPTRAKSGDLCKVNDVYHIYLANKWHTFDEAESLVYNIQVT